MIEAGMEASRTATGLRPNLMTMGAGVMALLKVPPGDSGRYRSQRTQAHHHRNPAGLFQIEEIVIVPRSPLPSMKAANG
ncbi:hypothetical protein LQQ57_24255 [Escherichia coli]|nr:hypothetical protein [Escherichia coli]